MMMKTCSRCGQAKPATLEFFHGRNQNKALRSICKTCHGRQTHANYLLNAEKVIEAARTRRRVNKEHYRALNTSAQKIWRVRNKARHRRTKQMWYAENNERYNEVRRAHYPKLRQRIMVRLNDAVRARVRQFVQKNGESKSRYLPFSPEDLKVHLERQFRPGMSWSNFGKGKGKWNIDHIVPLSTFNFETMGDPEFRAAWALPNLRPLWHGDNMAKGAIRTLLL